MHYAILGYSYTISISQTFSHVNNIAYIAICNIYCRISPHIAGNIIYFCLHIIAILFTNAYSYVVMHSMHCSIAAIIALPLVAIIAGNIFSIAQPYIATSDVSFALA